MKPTINIIGAGRLGKTLAKRFVQCNVATVNAVANTALKSADDAIAFIGEGVASTIAKLPPADITLIATPDDDIQTCCDLLARTAHLKSGSIVFHCSGSLSSKILRAAKARDCLVASVHPMRSFADPVMSVEAYEGTYCGVEGDSGAVNFLHKMFQRIGSVTFDLNANKKSMYHIGGVFASNYLVTLYHQAVACLKEAEVDADMAHRLVINLLTGTLNNLSKTASAAQALTGPIKRGDLNTLSNHLEALSQHKSPALYKQLGLSTAELANLPDVVLVKLSKLLAT